METAKRESYTKDEYAAAKQADIAVFLMSIGYELTRTGNCYKGKLHDSLAIRDDGRWYWNSRHLRGYSPIELYKHILLEDYGYSDEITAAITAIKQLANGQGAVFSSQPAPRTARTNHTAPALHQPASHASQPPTIQPVCAAPMPQRPTTPPSRAEDTPLLLPAPHKNNNRVMAYLCQTRGLDATIVRGLIRDKMIYETIQSYDKAAARYVDTPYHNAVFVGYDKPGRPQSAFLRGTMTFVAKGFKKDADFSDKSFPFTLRGHGDDSYVYAFESAIDAISHASMWKQRDYDWQSVHRIALGGTSFLGLDRFLRENSQVTAIVACLDNDRTGDRRSVRMTEDYTAKGYAVCREAPKGKDFNEDLLKHQCMAVDRENANAEAVDTADEDSMAQ